MKPYLMTTDKDGKQTINANRYEILAYDVSTEFRTVC
jgi:hypothetical protein